VNIRGIDNPFGNLHRCRHRRHLASAYSNDVFTRLDSAHTVLVDKRELERGETENNCLPLTRLEVHALEPAQ